MMELRQKKLFKVKEYSLGDLGLKLKTRSLTSSLELEIPYEEIMMSGKYREKKLDQASMWLSIVFGGIFLINFLISIFDQDGMAWGGVIGLFVIASFCMIVSYVEYNNHILIPTMNNGFIQIYQERPSKESVNSFIDQFEKTYSNALMRKYGTIDLNLPKEAQLNNLMWLMNRGVINLDEFEKLKTKLSGKESAQNQIGFNKN